MSNPRHTPPTRTACPQPIARPDGPPLSIWALLVLEQQLRRRERANAARRQLLERCRKRCRGQCPPQPGAEARLPAAAPPAGVLVPHLDDRQIRRAALRAVLRFSDLDPDEAEAAWAEWEAELRRRFPPYAAAEVLAQVDELRDLL